VQMSFREGIEAIEKGHLPDIGQAGHIVVVSAGRRGALGRNLKLIVRLRARVAAAGSRGCRVNVAWSIVTRIPARAAPITALGVRPPRERAPSAGQHMEVLPGLNQDSASGLY